eukprot:364027-Chlamydomonas_euryale.AAC.2
MQRKAARKGGGGDRHARNGKHHAPACVSTRARCAISRNSCLKWNVMLSTTTSFTCAVSQVFGLWVYERNTGVGCVEHGCGLCALTHGGCGANLPGAPNSVRLVANCGEKSAVLRKRR